MMSPDYCIINGFIIASLLVTIGYFIGLHSLINNNSNTNYINITEQTNNNNNNNKKICEMTYMFEYPQYVRISDDKLLVDGHDDEKTKPTGRNIKYALYAYSEGRYYTERARNMHFDGIPVLFIPGNAGSYRQVRSLASIALRKAINSRTSFHFDYFTVDLNDELTALNGALLTDHLAYVNASIYRILDLYTDKSVSGENRTRSRQNSIVLVGHSMGGIIASSMANLLLSDDDSIVTSSLSIPIVLALATPFKRPPLFFDTYIKSFYQNNADRNGTKTSFISVSGGFSDFLVSSSLTDLSDSSNLNNNKLSVVSTNIPLAWVQTDHLSILWCKQVVLALNRALFDSVDIKTKQISSNSGYRQAIFHHHLVHHSGIKSHNLRQQYYQQSSNNNNNKNSPLIPIDIDNDIGDWIERIDRQYTIVLSNGTKRTQWYMIRLFDSHERLHERLTVIALNLDNTDWVFTCGAHVLKRNSRVCDKVYQLTHLSEIAPSERYKRRNFHVNLHELKRNHSDMSLTHLVVKVLPTNEPVTLHFDVYGLNERQYLIDNLPNIWTVFKSRTVLIKETADKAVNYELLIPQLRNIVQSYQLYVDAIKCQSKQHHATASVLVPWGGNQNYHKTFTDDGRQSPLILRLYSSKPPTWINNNNDTVVIRLTLDPNCRYRISIHPNILGQLAQIVQYHTPLLVTNVAAVILMTFKSQLNDLSSSNGGCRPFFIALKDGAKPYYILTSVKLLSRLLNYAVQLSKDNLIFLPRPDSLLIVDEGDDFFLLPLILYMCSVGIVWIVSVVLAVSMVIFESTIHKMAIKFLQQSVRFTLVVTTWWSSSDNLLINVLYKIPSIVAITLICLTLTTSGGLALCLGAIFYYLKLTQLAQNYIDEMVWFMGRKIIAYFITRTPSNDVNLTISQPQHQSNAICFHGSLFLIWSIIALINLPSVLTWAHNYKYSTVLHTDPAFYPALILSVCALPLWQMDLPKLNIKWYNEIGQLTMLFAALSLIYAQITIYRLNYFLSFVIVVVVLHQLFASKFGTTNIDNDDDDGDNGDDGKKIYDDIKAKLE